MYSYSVELVGLQSTDYSTENLLVLDGDQYARFYEPPSVVFPDTSPAKNQKHSNKNHCLELYGLEERRILTEVEISHLDLKSMKQHGVRQSRYHFGYKEQQQFVQKHFDGSVPDFICNMSTLKILMTQHTDFKLRATALHLEDGRRCIYIKYHNMIKPSKFRKAGYLVEDILAVNEVESNHVLEAVYSAKLSVQDENGCATGFHIGFLAETDGIWNCKVKGKDNNEKKYDATDIAEVKSVNADNFYSSLEKRGNRSKRRNHKNPNFNHYHYEEDVLRLYWAHCYLRGIEKLLCAVLEGERGKERMKEVWLYNVNKIPSLLKKKNKNARPFPKVGFKNLNAIEQKKYTELHQILNWEEWNEETEFRKLSAALDDIINSFDETDWTRPRYFVHRKGEGLRVAAEHEFDQF